MRLLQIPLWWTLTLIVALFFASANGDLAASITFASVFGFVFGGGMQAIKTTPKKESWPPRKRRITRPNGQMMRPPHTQQDEC